MEDLKDLIRIAKEKDAIRTAAKAKRFSAVISAENEVTSIFDDFYHFLDGNGYRLVGKKIFLANNDKSKLFTAFIKEFTDMIVLSYPENSSLQYFSITRTCGKTTLLNISFCIWGGHTQNDTEYTQYIERGVYDIFEIDESGILTGFKLNNLIGFKKFIEPNVIALKAEISAIEQKIAELKSLLYSMNRSIPNGIKNL